MNKSNTQKKHICATCSKEYRNKKSLSVHSFHHLPPAHPDRTMFTCSVCSKIFPSKNCLEKHKKICQVPLEERPEHFCPICSYGPLSTKSGVFSHMTRHTITLSQIISTTIDIDKLEEVTYSCSYCKTRIESSTALIEHLKCCPFVSQSKHNLFKCPVCGKVLSSAANLKNHKLLHLSAYDQRKPIYCTRCDKRFTTISNLRQHEIVHTPNEERDYKHQCTYCDRKYRYKSHLKSHLKARHEANAS